MNAGNDADQAQERHDFGAGVPPLQIAGLPRPAFAVERGGGAGGKLAQRALQEPVGRSPGKFQRGRGFLGGTLQPIRERGRGRTACERRLPWLHLAISARSAASIALLRTPGKEAPAQEGEDDDGADAQERRADVAPSVLAVVAGVVFQAAQALVAVPL